MDLKPTLTVRDCGAYLGLSKATIDRLISAGKLRSYKNGRLRKVKKEWLMDYEKQLIDRCSGQAQNIEREENENIRQMKHKREIARSELSTTGNSSEHSNTT